MPWLIPLILMAASMGANYQGQKKVDKARAGAMGEARRRRERSEKETAQKAQSTADLLVKSASDEKTRAAELEQTYKTAGREAVKPTNPVGVPLDAMRSGASTATVQDTRLRDRALAEADALAKGRAQLGSFGDVMVGSQIAAGRNASDIDAANAGVRNWNQSVLPLQLDVANQSGRQWNTLADVLQFASMLTTAGALTAPGGAGGAAASRSAGTAASDAARMRAAQPNPFMYA